MLADVTVPHSWFIHFYTLSIAACLFWLGQIGAQQPGHIFLLAYTKEPANPVPAVQVIVAWLALLLLSIRRYLECQEAEPSKSRMFFGHWIMGLLFYAVTSVAVWIEGDRKLLLHNLGDVVADKDADTQTKLIRVLKQLLAILFADLPTRDRILVLTGLALFFLAASTQSNFHGYLKYMKQLTKGEYTLPQHPLFDYTVTPHYAAECVEYLGLAMIVAPVGQVFNTTMLCCLVFVVVNLGVTADGTREWYKKKFGEEEIGGKARMIPFIW
jgi:3-oxo-5-alpha-steroid 4-dehydrogenase 3